MMVKFYIKWIFVHCSWEFLKKEYAVLSLFYLGIFPIICLICNKKIEQYITWKMILFVIIVGLCFFVIDGVFIRGYLRPVIMIKNKLIDSTKITIAFGNIFSEKGTAVIAVNEFFDNEVSSRPNAQVAEQSLHGKMIRQYWMNNPDNWYSQVVETADPKHTETVKRNSPCKCDRYPIGTTGIAISGEKQFICVALSHTDIKTLTAKADLDDLRISIANALKRGRETCSGQPLIFPIMGGSLSRTGIPKFMLLNLLIMEILTACKESFITSEIKIILPFCDFSHFNLAKIKKDWEEN